MSTFGSAIDGVATNVTTETKTVQTGRTRVYGVQLFRLEELEYMEFIYLVLTQLEF